MRAPFTRAGFGRGFRMGLALAGPIFLYGVAFGLVAAQAGLGWGWALAISGTVFPGSARLGALSLIQAGEADRACLAGTGVPLNAAWLAGTPVGLMSGGILPDPRAFPAQASPP